MGKNQAEKAKKGVYEENAGSVDLQRSILTDEVCTAGSITVFRWLCVRTPKLSAPMAAQRLRCRQCNAQRWTIRRVALVGRGLAGWASVGAVRPRRGQLAVHRVLEPLLVREFRTVRLDEGRERRVVVLRRVAHAVQVRGVPRAGS